MSTCWENLGMQVSVIIPAHNAAGTIGQTLESLLAQTFPSWEAIIVDDSSTDETEKVVASFSARDDRIRIYQQSQQGVSAARNRGIATAQFDWLLFLDADDWILPQHLEKLTEKLSQNPQLDAVHCGWVRVAQDGRFNPPVFGPVEADIFSFVARTCSFAIHTCVVRRKLVQELQGFDTSLAVAEDIDLWQRLARTGAHFAAIPEVLACYRIRCDSASNNGLIIADLFRVIERGHSPDPRVSNPAPAHAAGEPKEKIVEAKFYVGCWAAGLMLGQGKDACEVIKFLGELHFTNLYPPYVANVLHDAALLPQGVTVADWPQLWPKLQGRLHNLLCSLEKQAQVPGLARRVIRHLARLILENAPEAVRPLKIGPILGVCLELSQPISEIEAESPVEILLGQVQLEGKTLGNIELPICDGAVPGAVLADAIAVNFAWPILQRFFEAKLYPELEIRTDAAGKSVWRGAVCLASNLPAEEDLAPERLHNTVGWTVFLQELWARQNWSVENFYKTISAEDPGPLRRVEESWIALEVSEDLPEIETPLKELTVEFLIGGLAVANVNISVEDGRVCAQQLRIACNENTRFELCCAAVREGLVGKSFSDSSTLRERLQQAAQQRAHAPTARIAVPEEISVAPDFHRAANRAFSSGDSGFVLARQPDLVGTSASRWVSMPVATAEEISNASKQTGEWLIEISPENRPPARFIYAPDVLWMSRHGNSEKRMGEFVARDSEKPPSRHCAYDRSYFEDLFATRRCPWDYTTDYEKTKYRQTLELLPRRRFRRALELGCAEGHFTIQLAPLVEKLIAADISVIALKRVAARCAGCRNISFEHIDLTREALPDRLDLIVCSEMLYYIGEIEQLQTACKKLFDALAPGGCLLTAHANLIADDPRACGFDWGLPFGAKKICETFLQFPHLRLLKELRTPLYRIQLFQRDSKLRELLPKSLRRVGANKIISAKHAAPDSLIAAYIKWQGGAPQSQFELEAKTEHLSILMYHRVARAGSAAMSRWRVTPEAFEEQLAYLRDSNYYSISLRAWNSAREQKKLLPGRPVLITFDDGYQDFLSEAWPLLKKYGFGATVFLVTEAVGLSNVWDSAYGETIPLLDWAGIRQLRSEGVEFGSHTASHRPLTGLSHEEVVREAVRSRAAIARELADIVDTISYPHGEFDPSIQHLVGAAGYVFGLSCRHGRCRFQDPLLALPRIEILGTDDLADFVSKLSS